MGGEDSGARYRWGVHFRSAGIDGAWIFTPRLHQDHRGVFFESMTRASLQHATGRDLDVAQMNVSTSSKGVIRGVHAAHSPQGQAKYVQCLLGRILDVIVDLRPTSPTFGMHCSHVLDDTTHKAMFIAEGLGHAFCVLSDVATVAYLTSAPYDPLQEFSINPLDPDLDLPWPTDINPVLSLRDGQGIPFREFDAASGTRSVRVPPRRLFE